MTVLAPVLAAVTAAAVGFTGTPPASASPACDPPSPSMPVSTDTAATTDRIRGLAAVLAGQADDPRAAGLGQQIHQRVTTTPPADVGNCWPAAAVVTAALEIPHAEMAQQLVADITATIRVVVLAVPTEAPDGDEDGGNGDDGGDSGDEEGGGEDDGGGDSDEGDEGGDDSGDEGDDDGASPSPAPLPTPTPAPAPLPAPPVTVPPAPSPSPAPRTSSAAHLEAALRELATTLQASSDPAMQQLGTDLLGILVTPNGTAPQPAPGTPRVPGPPAIPEVPVPLPAVPAIPPVAPPSGTLPSVLPAGAKELFSDDFEGGDLGKWGTCQGAGVNGECAGLTPSDGMGVGQDPERGMVAQFKITDGEEAEMGGERSEVRDSGPGTSVQEGDERWYSWSMKFPEDLPEPDGGYYIVVQWHQSADSGSPPLALDITNGNLEIGGDGVDAPPQAIGPIRRGEWVDYVMNVGFSQNDGFVEAWENGVQTVQRTSRPTMTDDENYLKMGIYRDPDATGDAEVWFDDFRIFDGNGGGSASTPPSDDPPRGDEDAPDGGSDGGEPVSAPHPALTRPVIHRRRPASPGR